jgi:hypothetical protein
MYNYTHWLKRFNELLMCGIYTIQKWLNFAKCANFTFCKTKDYLIETPSARAKDDDIGFLALWELLVGTVFDFWLPLKFPCDPVGSSLLLGNTLFFGFSSYESVSLNPVSRLRSFSKDFVFVFFLREDVTTLDMILLIIYIRPKKYSLKFNFSFRHCFVLAGFIRISNIFSTPSFSLCNAPKSVIFLSWYTRLAFQKIICSNYKSTNWFFFLSFCCNVYTRRVGYIMNF